MSKATFYILVLPAILTCLVWAPRSFYAAEKEEKNSIYSPFGKRDPFRASQVQPSRGVSSLNPLERYAADQFRLRAIIRSVIKPSAMFLDPLGRSHILTEGDSIGKEKAVISRILASEVILTQRTTNYLGNENLTEKVVSLPEEDPKLRDGISQNRPVLNDATTATAAGGQRGATEVPAAPLDAGGSVAVVPDRTTNAVPQSQSQTFRQEATAGTGDNMPMPVSPPPPVVPSVPVDAGSGAAAAPNGTATQSFASPAVPGGTP